MLIKAKDTNKAKASEVVEVELFVVVVVLADVTLEDVADVAVVFAEVAFEEVEAEVTFEDEEAADEDVTLEAADEDAPVEAADEEVTLEAADEEAPVEAADEELTLFAVQATLAPRVPNAVQVPTGLVCEATALHPVVQVLSVPQSKDCSKVELHIYFV